MGSRRYQTGGVVWKGDPVECYSKALKNGNFVFYEGFVFNGEVYSVGDFALCNYKPGGRFKTRVCRLMTLYNSNEQWHADAKEKAVVRWYTWARELESRHNPQRVKFDVENEVIEDYRGFDVFISLKNLVRKCRVVFATEEDPIDLIRREQLNRDLYFSCRYKIVGDEIEAIFTPDSKWPVEKEGFTTLSTYNSPLKRRSAVSNESESPVKSVRLTPKMDQLSIASPQQKQSVRRNLNDSFADVLSPEYGTPTLNYSIVSPSSQSKDAVKIKLRLSQKRNPQVILESLADDVVQNYLKPRADVQAAPSSALRRSSRSIQRKSYAELISPEKIIPIKEFNAENAQTPTKHTRRKLLNTPTRISSVGRQSKITPKTYQKTTPSKRKSTPSRRVAVLEQGVSTSRLKQIKQGVITPSVARREGVVRVVGTPLQQARSHLHVSYVPEVLPCREREYSDILRFVAAKLEDGCGGCMYISGVPGTGKTATVTSAIRKLQQMAEDGDIPQFEHVNLNGMRLTEPRQAYVEILKQLTGKTVLWEQAQSMLDNRFSKSKKAAKPVIMLVDELDILCTRRQDVVYNLLDWPTKANAQLIVVTIANTMDLPERLLMGRVTSRLGLTRLTFQPYSFRQLQDIVQKRLEGLDTFNPDAVQLVARKVASVSGDARRALDICRRATELAESDGGNILVNMSHVTGALNLMITEPKVQAIRYCSRLEQLVLQATVAEVERTGVEETTFANVYTMLKSLSTLDGFAVVSQSRAMQAVSRLGACHLLLTDEKCSDINQKIILNVTGDDIYYALRRD